MLTIRQTESFARWLKDLRDATAAKRIASRIALLQAGHLGDVKSVGDKVSELRIDHGPGYRLYLTRQDSSVIVLLVGGDKGSQSRDIASAKEMAATWK